MKNKFIYRILFIFLIVGMLFNSFVFRSYANPAVAVSAFTAEGYNAFVSFLALAGFEVSGMGYTISSDDVITEEEFQQLFSEDKNKALGTYQLRQRHLSDPVLSYEELEELKKYPYVRYRSDEDYMKDKSFWDSVNLGADLVGKFNDIAQQQQSDQFFKFYKDNFDKLGEWLSGVIAGGSITESPAISFSEGNLLLHYINTANNGAFIYFEFNSAAINNYFTVFNEYDNRIYVCTLSKFASGASYTVYHCLESKYPDGLTSYFRNDVFYYSCAIDGVSYNYNKVDANFFHFLDLAHLCTDVPFDYVVNVQPAKDYDVLVAALGGVGTVKSIDYDGEKVAVRPNSYVDKVINGTASEDTFTDVVDTVIGSNTVTDESIGVDVPVTGVGVLGGSVVVDDDGNAVYTPAADVVTKPLTGVDEVIGEVSEDVGIGENVSDLDILGKIWKAITDFFTNFFKLLAQLLKWFAGFLIGSGSLDLSKFNVASGKLITVFPFCIPFDMLNILNLLNASPEAPVFEFDFNSTFLGNISGYNFYFEINFADLSEIIILIKSFIFIIFAIGLCRVTRDIIRG